MLTQQTQKDLLGTDDADTKEVHNMQKLQKSWLRLHY